MSAEPARKKAYSADLRWRIIYQRLAMELPFYKIATNLNVASSTAHRTYHLFITTSDVASKRRKVREELKKLDTHNELLVIGLILDSPVFERGLSENI